MQADEAVDADDLDAAVDHLSELVRAADVEAGGEEVAGVEAQPQAPAAAGEVDQLVQLLE